MKTLLLAFGTAGLAVAVLIRLDYILWRRAMRERVRRLAGAP